MTFIQSLNEQYFSGSLSGEVLDLLEPINRERTEVQEYVERMSRYMHHQKIDARDFSEATAWIIAEFIPKLLPGAWNDAIPPITSKGRHVKIDQYLLNNPWRKIQDGHHFLDLGCGFPPETSVDTAATMPGVQVTGADPSFGAYLIKDAENNYACFDAHAELLYFQAENFDIARWEAMYADPEATRLRYLGYLERARTELDKQPGKFAKWEHMGVSVRQNPVLEYERDNLNFMQQGIGSEFDRRFDIIRCFNVLIYFDREFRNRTIAWASENLVEGGLMLCGMNWIQSRAARYSIYQSVNGVMNHREFAISIDNMRPIEIVTWFSLYDQDYETAAMVEVMRILRSDGDFVTAHDRRLDELLAELNFCTRNTSGYLGGLPEVAGAELMEEAPNIISSTLEREGYVEAAVDVLQRNGLNAWVNAVGHIALDPDGLDMN